MPAMYACPWNFCLYAKGLNTGNIAITQASRELGISKYLIRRYLEDFNACSDDEKAAMIESAEREEQRRRELKKRHAQQQAEIKEQQLAQLEAWYRDIGEPYRAWKFIDLSPQELDFEIDKLAEIRREFLKLQIGNR